MKNFAKITLGALVVAGATLAATAAADARVSVGIGIGAPGYYGPPAYSYSCDPYSRWGRSLSLRLRPGILWSGLLRPQLLCWRSLRRRFPWRRLPRWWWLPWRRSRPSLNGHSQVSFSPLRLARRKRPRSSPSPGVAHHALGVFVAPREARGFDVARDHDELPEHPVRTRRVAVVGMAERGAKGTNAPIECARAFTLT